MNTMKEKQVTLSLPQQRQMIAKIEKTLSTAQQIKDRTKTTTMLATRNNDSTTESHP